MNEHIYFGDIHSHCDIAYGHGTLKAALKRARQQLDFCSVTGQAAWPDMLHTAPATIYPDIVEAHKKAFRHFSGRYKTAFREIWDASSDQEFVTFPSYEICSSEFGDHTIVGNVRDLPLNIAQEPSRLAAGHDPDTVLIYPHHIGYKQGLRGINWDKFDESVSPFVEIYSLHGCSESDESLQPMHLSKRMSFRDGVSTVSHGLRAGKKFGLVAGTDHHAGWPGSHGHGRMAVYSPSLDRRGIWEGLKRRRVYALTGDNIRVQFDLETATMGETVHVGGGRRIGFEIEAFDFIDTVDLLRNERPIWQSRGRLHDSFDSSELITVKVRIEWGGVDPGTTVEFDGKIKVEGELIRVDPCFRGPNVVSALQRNEEELDLPHQITSHGQEGVSWWSRISQPLEEFYTSPQAIVVTLRMKCSASLCIEVNGQKYKHKLEELLLRSVAHQLRGIHREGIRICRAVPESCFRIAHAITDENGEKDIDCYRLRVRQTNDQYAWTTPIWAER